VRAKVVGGIKESNMNKQIGKLRRPNNLKFEIILPTTTAIDKIIKSLKA
jgi:hypothetical protein